MPNFIQSKEYKEQKLQFYRDLAKSKGGKCLAKEYTGAHARASWECKECHIWETKFCNISNQHQWCKKCSGSEKHDIGWLCQLAQRYNGKCLSKNYKNNKTKYLWQCKKGHQWYSNPKDINRGWAWCAICSRTAKHDIEWLQNLAKKNKGICLATVYKSSKSNYLWQCEKNHEWTATGSSISRGSWCAECKGLKRKDINYLHQLAKINNGMCLSKEYNNSNTKYKWQCNKNHTWLAIAGDIKGGHWCPFCFRQHSKGELEVFAFVKTICPNVVNDASPYKNKRFKADMYIDYLGVVIEYDGSYWHTSKWKHYNPERDERKNKEAEKLGLILIRIKEEDFISNKRNYL